MMYGQRKQISVHNKMDRYDLIMLLIQMLILVRTYLNCNHSHYMPNINPTRMGVSPHDLTV